MKKNTVFDLIVVYSEKLATSAKANSITPFKIGSASESYNQVYSYFLDVCRKKGLNTAFSTSADITGAGRVGSYWITKNHNWSRIKTPAYSKTIFDKFSPTTAGMRTKRELMFSSNKIRPFNNPYLYELCFDKQKTYDKFKKFSIPTVSVLTNTKKGVMDAANILAKKIAHHSQKSDFSPEVILKDRFGAGGLRIYKFNSHEISKIANIVKTNKKISFVLQPFVNFDKGFSNQNVPAPTDIRLIYLDNKIIQTYTRVAKKGDYKCNEHEGGLLTYIPKTSVPKKVLLMAKNISEILNKKTSLFALDFIISNNGNVYLLEANTGPGLDWNLAIKENELESKKLMRKIIHEIARRVQKPTAKRAYIPTRADLPVPPALISLA